MSMSLFGILFIIAIILAIPTWGLSFVALYFAKKWINANEAKQIAAAAINAANTDETTVITFKSAAAAKRFFETYGSTDKKFQHLGPEINPNLKQAYIGYVKVIGQKELVVLVTSEGGMTYVATFDPVEKYGNDMLSLLSKQSFMETVISSLREQS
jgi:Na+-transporting methylmalonyl-CoA/oxaloacetate decarboxylase gamma subunit